MKSLEFQNLPLYSVSIRVLPQGWPLPMDFESLVEMRHRINLPKVVGFETEKSANSFTFRLNDPGAGVTVTSDDSTLVLSATSGGLNIQWTAADAANPTGYPRYANLRNLAIAVFDGLNLPDSHCIANINYTNLVKSGGLTFDDVGQFINAGYLPAKVEGSQPLWEYRVSYRRESGSDCRIGITPIPENLGYAFAIETGAGADGPCRSWLTSLDLAHDESQEFFNQIITTEARNLWSQQP